jgi:hypothetical protein
MGLLLGVLVRLVAGRGGSRDLGAELATDEPLELLVLSLSSSEGVGEPERLLFLVFFAAFFACLAFFANALRLRARFFLRLRAFFLFLLRSSSSSELLSLESEDESLELGDEEGGEEEGDESLLSRF